MVSNIDYTIIVKYAWMAYDSSRVIKKITDISAKVSTNYVYKITFENEDSFIIAKLSYFGKYEHFVEDHTIINVLSNNLPYPFDNLLSRALMKGEKLFVHRFQNDLVDAWVIFYRPVKIKNRLPPRLNETQIKKLAVQFAKFHKACYLVRNTLPESSKTLKSDIDLLQKHLQTNEGKRAYKGYVDLIEEQCNLFVENTQRLNVNQLLHRVPVFVDWNIGNFSVVSSTSYKFYSRWDYDWFRMSSRMLDFYFISRVVSDIGDRAVFTYNIGPLMEERFILFLKHYHQVYPLKAVEIHFLKEVYRFFLLNYVIKEGQYFFRTDYAEKLQREVFETHFATIDKDFDANKLLKALDLEG